MESIWTKNKGFYILFGIFIITLIIDFYSTIINKDLIIYLESNPLYQFGGLPLIMMFNVVFLTIYFYWYTHSKNPNSRFVIIFTLVTITITRLLVIKNNFAVNVEYVANPEVVMAAAKQVTQSQKIQYVKEYAMLNVLPLFTTLFTWLFFTFDHKVEIK